MALVTCVLLLSCSEEDNPVTPTKGNIFITSSPSGAQIWLQGVNTTQVTPDTLMNITPGSYLVTLKLQNYEDTTFTVSVTEGQITSKSVDLISTVTTGSIYLTSIPSGAEIWLNGVNTTMTTPDTAKNLVPGSYDVTLKLQDYIDTTFTVSVTLGQVTSKNITLIQIINTGSIYLTSIPSGAEIWLDGVNTTMTTPDTIKNLTPGNYDVTLKLQNYSDTTFTVSVTAGQTTSQNVTLVLIVTTGNIYIFSNPAGAQIWIDGVNTLQTTPDTVKNIDEGLHNVTLKLEEYRDTTFAFSVTAGQTNIIGPIVLISDINTTLYGPVRIFETAQSGPSEQQGLDLSSGIAYGITSPQAYLIDIYYYTDAAGTTFQIQSADLYPNLVRVTDFLVGSGTNLFDGYDSPLRNTGTWTDHISDREDNYVFLYDHDGHYSKLKIVNWGGGFPGDPAWVEVQWYYNNTVLDERFQ